MAIHIAINISRFNKPNCQTRSAFDKNLNAKAISNNPKTTLTEFNQPPDLGKELSHPGKAANNPKGSANAREKPNIMVAGPIKPPFPAPAKAEPTIGPVQENDTNAKVNAMKNKSYIGISFIVLIFGIWAVPKIIAKFQKSDLVEIGPVPAFELTDQNNNKISNTDYLGKVYVVEFFFS